MGRDEGGRSNRGTEDNDEDGECEPLSWNVQTPFRQMGATDPTEGGPKRPQVTVGEEKEGEAEGEEGGEGSGANEVGEVEEGEEEEEEGEEEGEDEQQVVREQGVAPLAHLQNRQSRSAELSHSSPCSMTPLPQE